MTHENRQISDPAGSSVIRLGRSQSQNFGVQISQEMIFEGKKKVKFPSLMLH